MRRAAGPACNLTLKLSTGEVIDVDLVPTFEFDIALMGKHKVIWPVIKDSKWVSEQVAFEIPKCRVSRLELVKFQTFFAIPKKSKADKKASDEDKEWRLDFHDFERDVLKAKGCAKTVIKLMKASFPKKGIVPVS